MRGDLLIPRHQSIRTPGLCIDPEARSVGTTSTGHQDLVSKLERVHTMHRNVACLTESDVVCLIAGTLGETDRPRAQGHLEGCETCIQLVTAVAADSARASGSNSGH